MQFGTKVNFLCNVRDTAHTHFANSLETSRKSVALFLAVCLLLASCEPPGDERLWLYNQSNDTLYYLVSTDGIFPMTPTIDKSYPYILPNTNYNALLGTGKWDREVRISSPGTSLVIFSFLKEDIENLPWIVVASNKLYKESKYSLKEVEELHWHLPIPREK